MTTYKATLKITMTFLKSFHMKYFILYFFDINLYFLKISSSMTLKIKSIFLHVEN